MARRFVAVKTQRTSQWDPGTDNLAAPMPGGSQRGAAEHSVSSVRERSVFSELVWQQQPMVKRGQIGAALGALGWPIRR